MRNRQNTYPKDPSIVNPLIADELDGWVDFEKGVEDGQGWIALLHFAVERNKADTNCGTEGVLDFDDRRTHATKEFSF